MRLDCGSMNEGGLRLELDIVEYCNFTSDSFKFKVSMTVIFLGTSLREYGYHPVCWI
jgi:hypothetical protein